MNDLAIRVEGIGKRYRIGAPQVPYKTIRETLTNAVTGPISRLRTVVQGEGSKDSDSGEDSFIWALKDVSFEVKRGEVVGIIGRNGAGKTTLLKILSRITEPTKGYAEIRGRVGSLLEVGTGFHPELTGRENIHLNGAILGMKKAEIDRKFDEIVAFAEIEKFIDTPVKRYSSGMYVRLAFAVAAHLEPEIMLVDEVLAVGDAAFQKKCLGKMGHVAREGRTVLFVSHNMAAITGLCERAMLLDEGTLTRDAISEQVVQHYLSAVYDRASSATLKDRTDRSGDGSVKVVQIRLGTQSEPESGYWISGEDAVAELDYECSDDRTYRNVEVALGIRRPDQSLLLYLGTKVVRYEIEAVRRSGSFLCRIPRLPLEPGRYSVVVEIKQDLIIVDRVEMAAWVDVAEGDYYGSGVIWPYGGFLCDYSWSHCPNGSAE